ncbi:MAG: DUF2179 domain-containing protein [bacterium]|nr:DUF2179 domain-containing protein [bacterium]
MDGIIGGAGFITPMVIPLLIFLARIADVTIGTLRIIFVTRGLRFLSAASGFFEVFIWLLAIRQIMVNLDHWLNFFAYAAGFAAGNYVGLSIERYIAIGHIIIRVITHRDATDLEEHLRDRGFPVTSVDAEGEAGQVKLLFTVARRSTLPEIIATIKRFNPLAFYTVEDLRYVSQPPAHPMARRHLFSLRGGRKDK